jgi:hypothetical protein
MASGNGERERGVQQGGTDEQVIEHPSVGDQFLSEAVVVWAGHGSPVGWVRLRGVLDGPAPLSPIVAAGQLD